MTTSEILSAAAYGLACITVGFTCARILNARRAGFHDADLRCLGAELAHLRAARARDGSDRPAKVSGQFVHPSGPRITGTITFTEHAGGALVVPVAQDGSFSAPLPSSLADEFANPALVGTEPSGSWPWEWLRRRPQR